MRLALAGIAISLALAGCGADEAEPPAAQLPATSTTTTTPYQVPLDSRYCEPTAKRPPCGPGAERGLDYDFTLYTHCGIESARFDGRIWVADPFLDDGSQNPPPGWGNPSQDGTMTLEGPDRATFRARELTAHFKPAPPSYESPACD